METTSATATTMSSAPTLTTKDWVITLLISFIPVVGFVMLFVWAFGSNENANKANWAKATLIWYAIGLVLLFLLWGTIVAAFVGGAMNSGAGDF